MAGGRYYPPPLLHQLPSGQNKCGRWFFMPTAHNICLHLGSGNSRSFLLRSSLFIYFFLGLCTIGLLFCILAFCAKAWQSTKKCECPPLIAMFPAVLPLRVPVVSAVVPLLYLPEGQITRLNFIFFFASLNAKQVFVNDIVLYMYTV